MTYGTIAHLGTIEDELLKLARKTGEYKDITVGYERWRRKGGEWEFRLSNLQTLRSDSHSSFACSLELTYWLAANGCFEAKSKLVLSFPLNDEEKQRVVNEVSAMIDKIKIQVKSYRQ